MKKIWFSIFLVVVFFATASFGQIILGVTDSHYAIPWTAGLGYEPSGDGLKGVGWYSWGSLGIISLCHDNDVDISIVALGDIWMNPDFAFRGGAGLSFRQSRCFGLAGIINIGLLGEPTDHLKPILRVGLVREF